MLAIATAFLLVGCGKSKKLSSNRKGRGSYTPPSALVSKTQPDRDRAEVDEEEKYTIASMSKFLREYVELKYGKKHDFEQYVFVSVKYQNMYLIEDDIILKKYKVSTAKKGVGNANGSEKTPIGLHRISKKIGKGVPLGGRFVSRRYTGKKAKIYKDETKSKTDDITTRILWLEGLEDGLNRGKNIDSRERYIYIHGTSEEGLIGTPQSHGCIRMKNVDVKELFAIVDEGTPVLILHY